MKVSSAFYHPVVIWAATCFFTYTLGQALIGDVAVQLLLYSDGEYTVLIGKTGLCGDFNSISEWEILVCRLFYPLGAVVFIYVPFLLISLVVWVALSLHSRKLLWTVSRSQRWTLILSMSGFSLLLLRYDVAKFPEYYLFAGPIHGFHPLMPTVLSASSMVLPLLLWLLIDKVQKRSENYSD